MDAAESNLGSAAEQAAFGRPYFPVSGLYQWSVAVPRPFLPWRNEELRLDVDGRHPQMTASGVARVGFTGRVHWVANLTPDPSGGWTGAIWYKDGLVAFFPFSAVKITVQQIAFFLPPISATVEFSGGGPVSTRVFGYRSRFFHEVNLEFDNASNAAVNLEIDTAAHPNRPASLPAETLSIQEVFRRAGFSVATSAGGSVVPMAGAGGDALWSNQEMHDAMQVHWSHNAATAQWAVWVLYASLHEWGTGLGGIMFDDIGAQQRQGTALFNDSFIKDPPLGEPPADIPAWQDRMNFWTAIHETGHAFNLAHSWQKSLVYGGGGPWIPLLDEPEARSFMNYPYSVAGGEAGFFSDFEFRFSDQELLFLRHAPERFVKMGDAPWFHDHGFEGANTSPRPTLRLDVRVDKEAASYEFLEPIVIEMRLTNVSSEPQLVPENVLRSGDRITAVVRRDGETARRYAPYAQFCWRANKVVLQPGESLTESLFVSAGATGWTIAEPGSYTIQLALDYGAEDLVSNQVCIRVGLPQDREEERVAQDYFTDQVGRILAFDGTKVLGGGNDVLQRTIDQLPDRCVAIHAAVPLALSAAREARVLAYDDRGMPKITTTRADVRTAAKSLAPLIADPPRATATLGEVDYRYYCEHLGRVFSEAGAPEVVSSLAARAIKPRALAAKGAR